MAPGLAVRIRALGNRVGGIGSRGEGGRKVFVRGALPGELVRCSIDEGGGGRTFDEAALLEVIEPSPDRREPFCPHYGTCGGCTLQHLRYEAHQEWKSRWLERALARGGIEHPPPEPTVPSPVRVGCRNRLTMDVRDGLTCMHAHRGDPFPVESCPMLCRPASELLRELPRGSLSGMRRVSIRGSVATGSRMLELRGGRPGVELLAMAGAGTTVAWLSGEEWLEVPGGGGMRELTGGIPLTVPPGSFCQVNRAVAALLVERVAAECAGAASVLDLYGGVGTIGLPLAMAGMRVTSVELDARAAEACSRAAAEAGLESLEVAAGGVRGFLSRAVSSGRAWDAVVADPPRSGMGTRICRLLRRLDTDRLVLVSCNPFTLARDLAVLGGGGWEIASLRTFDMFPWTDHVETVATLERRPRV